MSIRPYAIWAIIKRNFASYFGNPSGYVFITAFIVASAFFAFHSDQFFARNIADLALLNEAMPWLLVVFLPAITMGAWADERRRGTHELLLTLPVNDIEVVIGKYIAALGVYTASLIFAFELTFVLGYLGNPDWGLLVSNFVGYWLMGAALIPVGLVASYLTANLTIAFILGAVLCAATVFVEELVTLIFGPESRLAHGIGVQSNFERFARGSIALPNVLYFILLAVMFLYFNLILLGQRHWLGGRHGRDLWWHYLIRAVAVVLLCSGASIIAGQHLRGVGVDATAERLNTLTETTRDAVKRLRKAEDEQSVVIRAFLSPDLPEDYQAVRDSLVRRLRDIKAKAGDAIILQIKEVDLGSEEARAIEDKYGIRARQLINFDNDASRRLAADEVILGMVTSSGDRESVTPFVGRGLPIEYEITRGILAVTEDRPAEGADRQPTIGILRTDLRVPVERELGRDGRGGADPAAIVGELRKQYRVVEVDPSETIDDRAIADSEDDIDVLIVPFADSLDPTGMANLKDYILRGRPCFLMVDPAPYFQGLEMSQQAYEEQRREQQMNPMMQRQRPLPPRGDLGELLDTVGVAYSPAKVAWDTHRPFRTGQVEILELPETVYAMPHGSAALRRIERARGESDEAPHKLVDGLSYVLTFFPGRLEQTANATTKFTPLLTTTKYGGDLPWDEAFVRYSFGFFQTGFQLNPLRIYGQRYALLVSEEDERGERLARMLRRAGYEVRSRDSLMEIGQDLAAITNIELLVVNGGDALITEARGLAKADSRLKGVPVIAAPDGDETDPETAAASERFILCELPQTEDELTDEQETEERQSFEASIAEAKTAFKDGPAAKRPGRRTIAARVTGPVTVVDPLPDGSIDSRKVKVNLIIAADTDFIMDALFRLREDKALNLDRVHNVPFILNAVDFLAGDEQLIALRNRQPGFRILERIEQRRQDFIEQTFQQKLEAVREARWELDEALAEREARAEEIEEREDLDEASKDRLLEQITDRAQRNYARTQARIEADREEAMYQANASMRREIRAIEHGIRRLAVVLPALPPLLLGVVVFITQQARARASEPES